MVEVNQLSKSFNGVRILNGVSLKAPCGEVTTIAGPNGIGKTTMLNVICGILYPDAGEVKFGEGGVVQRYFHRFVRGQESVREKYS